jgi:hypothetical protein
VNSAAGTGKAVFNRYVLALDNRKSHRRCKRSVLVFI